VLSLNTMRALVFALAVATFATPTQAQDFYFGADLSYVNEMEDCGAEYRSAGVVRDPYEIFRETGHNLVGRVHERGVNSLAPWARGRFLVRVA